MCNQVCRMYVNTVKKCMSVCNLVCHIPQPGSRFSALARTFASRPGGQVFHFVSTKNYKFDLVSKATLSELGIRRTSWKMKAAT